ncbi:unnamed protein product [Brugia timori]|uniref:Transcriptional regulator n=1 Tax=Brugia timori TaxID=42155 RepID=A0A0R3Q9L9_9BILA|nr:unnamed protein product [Brugia timori]
MVFYVTGDLTIDQWKELIWNEIGDFAEERAKRLAAPTANNGAMS